MGDFSCLMLGVAVALLVTVNFYFLAAGWYDE
jgi:hypothetical protein